MRRFSSRTIRSTLFAAVTAIPSIALAGAQFSADMIQIGPDGQSTSGKIYVGKDITRTDMTQGGQQVISVVDTANQVQWLVYPAQQSYMEMRGQMPADAQVKKPSGDVNPCAGGPPGVSCKNLGTEAVHGRQAVKWEMTYTHQGQTARSVQWIDTERGVPLRQELPDGQTAEMKLLGKETLNGRQVEKWALTSTRPNAAPQTSYQWYDARLERPIRQEFPGGYSSEMRNIKEGPQSASLFQIPGNFKKITPQQSGTQQSPRQ